MDPARASSLAAFLAGLFLLLGAGGCASDFERRYEAAEGLRQQAAARGYEWIQTAGLLEQAQQEAARGNLQAALELVETARFQSEAALRQADHEAEAWQNRVLK